MLKLAHQTAKAGRMSEERRKYEEKTRIYYLSLPRVLPKPNDSGVKNTIESFDQKPAVLGRAAVHAAPRNPAAASRRVTI
jgi:hypothetical protein